MGHAAAARRLPRRCAQDGDGEGNWVQILESSFSRRGKYFVSHLLLHYRLLLYSHSDASDSEKSGMHVAHG